LLCRQSCSFRHPYSLSSKGKLLTHLVLSDTSMMRKRHEIVMSSVMDSGV
jgi:hypothetical protein